MKNCKVKSTGKMITYERVSSKKNSGVMVSKTGEIENVGSP